MLLVQKPSSSPLELRVMRHCVYNMPAGDAALDSRVRGGGGGGGGGGGAALEVSSCHPGLPLADESATFVCLSANRKQALQAHLTNEEKAGDGLALSAKGLLSRPADCQIA